MERVLWFVTALMASFSMVFAQTGAQPTEQNNLAVQEVISLERELAEAFSCRDMATLEHLTADDFVAFGPSGQELTKAHLLARVTISDFALESLRHDEIRVRVFGQAAVATAVSVLKGRYKGEDVSGRFRYTRVWVKRNGRWQAVAAQSTALPQ